MMLSKQAQHTLKQLIAQRDKLASGRKAYHHSEAVAKLNGFITDVRNSAVYQGMPEASHIDADGIDTSNTVLLVSMPSASTQAILSCLCRCGWHRHKQDSIAQAWRINHSEGFIMKYRVYYHRPWRCWMGYWCTDSGDQICEAVDSPTKEGVLIELGTQRDLARQRLDAGKSYPN